MCEHKQFCLEIIVENVDYDDCTVLFQLYIFKKNIFQL